MLKLVIACGALALLPQKRTRLNTAINRIDHVGAFMISPVTRRGPSALMLTHAPYGNSWLWLSPNTTNTGSMCIESQLNDSSRYSILSGPSTATITLAR